MKARTEVTVEGRVLSLSNLDKVLYPRTGFTKGQVIDYYARIAPVLLPHLKDRPLTFKRYPDGVEGVFFFEKNCPSHRPGWVRTAAIWSRHKQAATQYCLCNDLPTLLWAANLAVLELHTSLALGSKIERPTMLVFDLDPGLPAALLECCQAALWLHDILEEMELQSIAKTSGSKGLQVYVPLNTPITYAGTKPLAQAIAQRLEREHPGQILSKMARSLRAGKVFVDWSQNDEHKTTVCVYSLRAREQPMVSAPVTWDEIRRAFKAGAAASLQFDATQILKRVEKLGDLFAPVLKLKQKLPTHQAVET